MKKRIPLIALILILAVLTAVVSALIVGAETPAVEASLSVTPEGGTATTTKGSLDDMLASLESALSPEVATTYTLTLVSNATAKEAVNLSGNGLETVNIKLDGYEISTAVSDFISVGNLAAFNLVGGFNNYGEKGAIVYSGTGSFLTTEATAPTVELSNLSISAAPAEGSAPVIDLVGGSFECEYVDMTLGGAADATAIATAGAKVTLRITDVKKTVASSTAPIVVNGAILRLERGSITADKCVELNGDAFGTIIDTVFTADTAVFTTSDATATATVNLGGVTVTAPAISAGSLTKSNIVAWYGTGSTYIKGFNPADTISLGHSAFSFTTLDAGYTVKTTSGEAAMTTTFPDRGTPTVKNGSTSTCMKVFNNLSAAPEVSTAYTFAALKGFSHSGTTSPLASTYDNITVFFDLNGFNLSRTKNGNFYTASGNHTVYIDGADALGNIGTIKSNVTTGGIMYNKNAEDDAFFSATNLNIVYTNQSDPTPSPVFQMVYGDAYFDNISFTYTGEDYTETASTSFYGIVAQTMSRAVVTNSNFKNIATNGIKLKALLTNGTNTYIVASDITADADIIAITSGSKGARLVLTKSNVTAKSTAYSVASAKSPIYVSETVTTLTGGDTVASGSVYFLYGKGNNIVKTLTDRPTGGEFEQTKYGFVYSEEKGGYVVKDTSEIPPIPEIVMPVIYKNNMVLQARKDLNITGEYGEDGTTILVELGDVASATAVVSGGKFTAKFTGLPYAKGITVTLTAVGKESRVVKYTGVDLGEVWVMSGQSNSVYDITNLEDFEEYRLNADNFDNIKAYIVNQSSALLEQTTHTSAWQKVDKAYLTKLSGTSLSSRNSAGLSGIAYVMATRLATEFPDATIAIIDANFNGSTVEAWMSYETAVKYAPEYAANYDIYRNYYEANGKYPAESDITVPAGFKYAASDKLYQRMATACYNKMIAPIDGFSVSGVVWYQGEGNGSSVTATDDGDYYACFKGVRETFRNTFADQNLPMFVIQIPPYFSQLSEFKNLQYKMTAEDANSYIVANAYVGPVFSSQDFISSKIEDSMVHYARKSPMGLSLAAEILENIYGYEYLGAPKIVSAKASSSYVTITFDRDITMAYGDEFIGFQLGNSAGEFKNAVVTVVDSKTLKLYAPGISVPKSVRYAYGQTRFELEDGNILPYDKNSYTFSATETANGVYDVTIKDKATGEVLYTFSSADPYVVRALSSGNVISTTGHSLPNFRIDL